jgi:hypothetical protein
VRLAVALAESVGIERNRRPVPVLGVDVHLRSLATRIPTTFFAALLCSLTLVCLASAPAGAVEALNWSTARIPGATALTGISCASETLCVAIDETGQALISTNPTAGASASWSRADTPSASALTAVSCPSNNLCAAVNKEGYALISIDPTAGAGASWSIAKVLGASTLIAISCSSNALCVAVGKSDAFASTNPAAGSSASWNETDIDSGHTLNAVSCPADTLCVAVDDVGHALLSTQPAAGQPWTTRQIDGTALTTVSCSAPPAGVCVAVDEAGDALASGNPSGKAPTWSSTPVDMTLGLGPPTAVSCTAAGLCVFVDGGGDAYLSDTPTTPAPVWTFEGIDPGKELSGASCVSEGLCAAVDGAGQVLLARVPAPTAATSTPSVIAETTATLTGTVNPQDAALTECRFEYGPSEAYGQSAPCATPLPIGGANQAVGASLSALTANTTYHFRLVASSASGVAVSLGTTFKTASPGLVQPHPSIGGLPARGQRLTCKSGVSASGVILSYAWLRDTAAIAGATGSTYTVSSADVSHHLQCRVTATNAAGSASATSSFVTVPAGGLGSIAETQVGTPHVAGSTVSVPLTCSAQAAGSCTITLRLTVVETLRGSHILAVAAQRTRRTTVTIGASTVHLGAGQRRTVTVTLNTTGRRLLAHLHRVAAKLSVSGTVVGAIRAPLRSVSVTLGGSSGKASSRKASAPHRR